MATTLRIAAAQYPLDALSSMAAYRAKVTRWVEDAAAGGAELLVFPEYGTMELATLHPAGNTNDGAVDAVTRLIPDIDDLHGSLAARHGVTIVCGSFLERVESRVVNAGHVFAASGVKGRFEKHIPTPWERSDLQVAGGGELAVFDIGKARIGIAICYDIEFPLIARALAEAGAEIILAPSNTDTERGYWRVRVGAMARALENQLYTVQCTVVGSQPAMIVSPENFGAAGVFAPPDIGLPANGVLALGEMNRPQWLVETVDLDAMRDVRLRGQVRNFADWREQPGTLALPKAVVVDLT